MKPTKEIRIEDYNYPLPEERIARYPLAQRDHSKLLHYHSGQIDTAVFHQLPTLLPSHSLLVFNNTRVIQARLRLKKSTGALIEIFCLEPKEPADYNLAFQARTSCQWWCLLGNAKKWKEGPLFSSNGKWKAERIQTFGDTHCIQFSWDDDSLSFADILQGEGELPIPPYLHRKTEESDKQNYQTVYSSIQGSVAAPTAGLHFTPSVLEQLDRQHIVRCQLTLHVGAGTFKPVKTDTLEQHHMHIEYINISLQSLQQLVDHPGPVIAVGTTSVRSLESLYYIGSLLHQQAPNPFVVEQWMPYQEEHNQISTTQALQAIIHYLQSKQLSSLHARTGILIAPGYRFRLVQGMLTNFHQPKSTLLLLVSAFIGKDWETVYRYALEHQFRFLSYGDSCLLLPQST